MTSKNSIKYFFISFILLSLFFSSCKKETPAYSSIAFGIFNLNNATTYTAEQIDLQYNGLLLNKSISSGLNSIKIPSGSGKLSFIGNNNLLLDTVFNVNANEIKNIILFQPVPTVKALILENNQASEPKPDAGFYKVKIANFAVTAIPKPVDIVFYFPDAKNKPVATYTAEKVITAFTQYLLVPKALVSNNRCVLKLIDSESKSDLISAYLSSFGETGKGVYTIYIFDSASGTSGTPIIGSTNKISLKTLFSN